MATIARITFAIALVFSFSSQAGAFEWPRPFGHGVEGSIGDRVTPFGSLFLDYAASNVDNDGEGTSRSVIVDGRLGARIQVAERLAVIGAVRTGTDHRTGYLSLGGGNFDDNFDFSISQLYADWDVPRPLGLVDRLNLAVGRQPLVLYQNPIYGETIIDRDLRLDGGQLSWDCGCDDEEDDHWDVRSGGSVGGWKLEREFDDVGFVSGPNAAEQPGFQAETARMFTVGTHAEIGPVGTPWIESYINYYHLTNIEDGFGGAGEAEAGIVDTPNIIQAGLGTNWDLGVARFSLAGEYIDNLDANNNESAWNAGASVTVEICNHDNTFSYLYQDVETWSVVPGLASDNFRGMNVGQRGHIVQGEYVFTDNVRLAVEGFIADPNNSTGEEDNWLVRTGLRVQFE